MAHLWRLGPAWPACVEDVNNFPPQAQFSFLIYARNISFGKHLANCLGETYVGVLSQHRNVPRGTFSPFTAQLPFARGRLHLECGIEKGM